MSEGLNTDAEMRWLSPDCTYSDCEVWEERGAGAMKEKKCKIVSLRSGTVNLLGEWHRMTWQFCVFFWNLWSSLWSKPWQCGFVIFLQRHSIAWIWAQHKRYKMLKGLKENDYWPRSWNLHGVWWEVRTVRCRGSNSNKRRSKCIEGTQWGWGTASIWVHEYVNRGVPGSST